MHRSKTTLPLVAFRPKHQGETECGSFIQSLCPNGEEGCANDQEFMSYDDKSVGGFEVEMPAPLEGVSTYGYRVRISEVGVGEEGIRCSERFYLLNDGDDTVFRSVSVESPTADDVLVAGGNYTVEVSKVKVEMSWRFVREQARYFSRKCMDGEKTCSGPLLHVFHCPPSWG